MAEEVTGEECGESKTIRICPHRCNSWWCPSCAEFKGHVLRWRLHSKCKAWQSCMMITLTVDPELFHTPLEQMKYVREKRCIARFVKALKQSGYLKKDEYFAVIEFHENGRPHYHLLIETGYCPHDVIVSAWNRFRPETAGPVRGNRPGFGSVWFSAPRFKSPKHAVNYATKYLVKWPKQGVPSWVMESRGQVHRYTTSHGFWPKEDDREPAVRAPKHDSSCGCATCLETWFDKQGKRKSIQERVERCEQDTVLMKCDPDGNMRYAGTLGLAFESVLEHLGVERAKRTWITEAQMAELYRIRGHQNWWDQKQINGELDEEGVISLRPGSNGLRGIHQQNRAA